MVSSGISSMKHFLSVSAIWKYRPDTHDKYRTKIIEMHGPFIFPARVEENLVDKLEWHLAGTYTSELPCQFFTTTH